MSTDAIFVGGGGEGYAEPQRLLLKYANRHGLIAGATGTGKTVTLQILAEGFSAAGVPVFLSDVKGDLAGLALPGSETAKTHEGFTSRAATIGLADYRLHGLPRHLLGPLRPSRATRSARPWPRWVRSSSSRMMQLTEAQEGVLNVAFRAADEEGLAAPRPQGPPGAARLGGRERQDPLAALRQRGRRLRRRDPAPAPRAREPGRHRLLRRTRARTRRHHAHRHRRAGPHQHPRRPTSSCPRRGSTRRRSCLAPVRALRGTARGRRSRQAAPRLLLRRGAPPLQRRAEGAGGQGGAGGAPHPVEGRGRLLHHPEPRRRAREHPRPARQPRAARAPRLHRARPEAAEERGRDLPRQPRASTPRPRSARSAPARP